MGGSGNGSFRASIVGGFNRADVVAYIEKTVREATETKAQCARLRDENAKLLAAASLQSGKLSALTDEKEALTSELTTLRNEADGLRTELADKDAQMLTLSKTVAELEDRAAKSDETVRSYEQIRGQLSQLEVEAAFRAKEIQNAAEARAGRMLERLRDFVRSFRQEYEEIRSGTEVTAAHLQGEMSRMGDRIGLVTSVINKTAEDLDELDKLIANSQFKDDKD